MQDDAKAAFEAWFDREKFGKRVLSPEGFARLVWQQAYEAARLADQVAHQHALTVALADARMAERERCAQIVERVEGWEGVREVAARIRA